MTTQPTPKVTIYSTPTCHFCHLVKDFLNENHIAFTDYNVGADLEKRKEMVDASGQMGVPVIVVEGYGKPIVGFNEEALHQALGL